MICFAIILHYGFFCLGKLAHVDIESLRGSAASVEKIKGAFFSETQRCRNMEKHGERETKHLETPSESALKARGQAARPYVSLPRPPSSEGSGLCPGADAPRHPTMLLLLGDWALVWRGGMPNTVGSHKQ